MRRWIALLLLAGLLTQAGCPPPAPLLPPGPKPGHLPHPPLP